MLAKAAFVLLTWGLIAAPPAARAAPVEGKPPAVFGEADAPKTPPRLGAKSGSEATVQPSTPFGERATVR